MSRLYKLIINTVDPLVPNFARPLWEHEAGPKTVFFWAPMGKWGLVFAGIGDFSRPPDTISVPQTAVLAATGFVWARFSLVIIPKNYNLFLCNFCLGLAQCYNIGRALKYKGL